MLADERGPGPKDLVGAAPARRPRRELAAWLAQTLPPASPGDLVRFVAFFSVLRWTTLCLAMVIGLSEGRFRETLLGAALLGVVALWLTVHPPRYARGGWSISAILIAEVALGVAIVEATGFSSSPFLITLCGATTIAGFSGGLRILSALAVLAGLSVAVPTIVLAQSIYFPHDATTAASVQLATLIVLVGGVGGYCRYLVEGTGQLRRGLAVQVEHLSRMNGLLVDLHATAEQLATLFDVDGTAQWVLDRLEALYPADVAAVLLRDPATGVWSVAAANGLRVREDPRLALPTALCQAADADGPVAVDGSDEGLLGGFEWGLYHTLRSEGELLGMLAVECRAGEPTRRQSEETIGDLAEVAALAIGNARWLQRLRVLSMEQERTRLARDLHDRISQSVVYLGLEVDRLADLNLGWAVQADLVDLRSGIGILASELRDTLVDLRSDVSEDADIGMLLRPFVDRINRRGAVRASLRVECDRRLPTMVERELWHIAREAVVNAERHARATHVSVLWRCDERGVLLEVADNGVGLRRTVTDCPEATSGFGMLGMQERADAIRAELEIASQRGRGTVIRARWSAP
jgi:signal transduction histidine kinase